MAASHALGEAIYPGGDDNGKKEGMAGMLLDRQTDDVAQQKRLT